MSSRAIAWTFPFEVVRHSSLARRPEGLGMIPLAEGVETEAQRAFLLEAGCALGQGYLFSRPVPAADIELASQAPVQDGAGVSLTTWTLPVAVE